MGECANSQMCHFNIEKRLHGTRVALDFIILYKIYLVVMLMLFPSTVRPVILFGLILHCS